MIIIQVIKIGWSIIVLWCIFCVVMANVRKKPGNEDTILIDKKMRSYAIYELVGFFGIMFIFQLIFKLMTLGK